MKFKKNEYPYVFVGGHWYPLRIFLNQIKLKEHILNTALLKDCEGSFLELESNL